MKFGAGYWSMAGTRLRPRHHALLYDEMIRDAQAAERLGYSDYWLVEHHFWYDGHINAELTALGALAAATDTIGIGTSCLLMPLHDPLRAAEMAATVDRLSGGRLRLVFGLGYRDEEYDAFGISRKARAPRLERSIELLDALWGTDGPIDVANKHFTYTGIEARPRPLQRRPLMYLGGFVPKTVERAAKYGIGLQLGPVISADQGRELVARYHEAAAEFGTDVSGVEIGICRDFWVAPTTAEARRVARPRLFHYYGETVALGWKLFRDPDSELIYLDRPDLLRAYASAGVDAAIVGDPATVGEEITKLRDAGFTYVQLRFRFDSQPAELIHGAMELFASDVMPAFAD